jgi:hypothetical protein
MADRFNNRILVAPLDWGLGHSTRCIPIIKHLQFAGCEVIIAADGTQKALLEKEFPTAAFVKLDGYRIEYTNSKRFLAAKILVQLPKLYKAARNERKWLSSVIQEKGITAVISDNRYGLYHPTTTCVFITHQLVIKAPFTIAEKILQKINYYFISRFSSCWVPDAEGKINLAGLLSHPKSLPQIPVKYIGVLSRFENITATAFTYNCLIILSGPEPQRTALENKMIHQLKTFEGKVMLVRGLPGVADSLPAIEGVVINNHLSSVEMEAAFNESEFIVGRTGYTTVMDICKLYKKSILIPTPGQTEQEYLAKHLSEQGFCLTAQQHDFNLKVLIEKAKGYHFKFPNLSMDTYKKVVEDFASQLAPAKHQT